MDDYQLNLLGVGINAAARKRRRRLIQAGKLLNNGIGGISRFHDAYANLRMMIFLEFWGDEIGRYFEEGIAMVECSQCHQYFKILFCVEGNGRKYHQ